MEKMKRFKRRLTQTLRGSHSIDESLSELAEQITIEENGLKDSGKVDSLFVCWSATPLHSFLRSSLIILHSLKAFDFITLASMAVLQYYSTYQL